MENITIDEFKKCDLRVGRVIAAERVEGSEKLLKLHIDLGEMRRVHEGPHAPHLEDEPQPRQILSGIGKAYAPENLVGKQVIIIANLEPRMMMGMESQGMLLAASDADGKPVVLSLGDLDGRAAGVAPGTHVT